MPGHWIIRIIELIGSNMSSIIGGSFMIDENITADMGTVASRMAEWTNARLGGLEVPVAFHYREREAWNRNSQIVTL